MRTQVRRLCGQASTGPSGVRDQSIARIRSPISPPPCRTAAGGIDFKGAGDLHERRWKSKAAPDRRPGAICKEFRRESSLPGLLGTHPEAVGPDLASPVHGSRKARAESANSARSRSPKIGPWPPPGTTRSAPLGIARYISSAISIGYSGSRSP